VAKKVERPVDYQVSLMGGLQPVSGRRNDQFRAERHPSTCGTDPKSLGSPQPLFFPYLHGRKTKVPAFDHLP
jgi:hypothetical protein